MIAGHQKQWEYLTRSADLGKISHALLFLGQEKIGKKSLAVEFAKYLNCQLSGSSDKKPCGVCQNCLAFEKGLSPDFILIEPDSQKKEIQISQIRKLIENFSLRSYSSGFKVVVIDKAHLMSQEAQNCFLKFLEEPKGKTVIILISERPDSLLTTVLSRTQKIKFSLVPIAEIEKLLLEKGAKKEEAKKFALIAFGKPGLAVDFFSNPEVLEKKKKSIVEFLNLIGADLYLKFQFAKSFSDEDEAGKSAIHVLEDWLFFLRVFLLQRLGQGSNFFLEGNDILLEKSKIKDYPFSKIKKTAGAIAETILILSTTNANVRLAIENLLVDL